MNMSKDRVIGVMMAIGFIGAVTSGFMPIGFADDALAGVSALIALIAFFNIK